MFRYLKSSKSLPSVAVRSVRVWAATTVLACLVVGTGCTPAQVRSFMDRHGIEHPPNSVVKKIAAALSSANSRSGRNSGASSASKSTASSFDSSISTVTKKRLGNSWRSGCPVASSDLRLLKVDYWGFDGKVHRGEIIVNTSIAKRTVRGFKALYDGGFRIEQMVTADKYIKRSQVRSDGSVSPSADKSAVNNTVGYVCRRVTNGRGWSKHAYGLAVDINPVQNPYISGSTVLPTNGVTSRVKSRGKLVRGGWAVQAFTDQGFSWGGKFSSVKDYMHFEA